MIVSGGVNIYPQEIERVIGATPGVWDGAVVGVPDLRFGEQPMAFVVPERSAAGDVPALVAAVRAACERELGRFKWPVDVIALERLPRTRTGKLVRRELREHAVRHRPVSSLP
ncbi:MAG TPA: class I adenylate-forming enzyme family protein [Caldimonas sp.]|jgi:long-chain acyl-CoA synthetase